MSDLRSGDAPINSNAYWERRFSSDWEAFGGREQSRVFMELLVKFLPAAVYEEIACQKLSILDCGCAEGDGSAVLAQTFPHSTVQGFDFSTTAVERARQAYPAIDFFVSTFLDLDRSADILISSNCFEHLDEPIAALARLASRSRRFVLLLVPFLEQFPTHPEHVRVVHAETFPASIEGWQLTYRVVVPPPPVSPQNRLLLIYEPAGAETADPRLGDDGKQLFLEASLTALTSTMQALAERQQEQLAALQAELADARSLAAERERLLEAAATELASARSLAAERESAHEPVQTELAAARSLLAERECALEALGAELTSYQQEIVAAREETLAVRQEILRAQESSLDLRQELAEREWQVRDLEAQLAEEERRRETALETTRQLAARLEERDSEAAHLQGQLAAIHASRLWRFGHIYWSLLRRLRPENGSPAAASSVELAAIGSGQLSPEIFAPPGAAHDVVCLPIIDWDFRFQRPQQLMLQLARHGHRVFYVAQTFRQEGEPYRLRKLSENVYEVSLRGDSCNVYSEALEEENRDRLLDSLNALRCDLSLGATAVVVQLPFWGPLVAETWRRFAWPIVYDCMDHHSGFSTNRPDMVSHERALLAGAHLVLASSRWLERECRAFSERVVLIPNGCDYEHFSRVGSPPRGERPVVGYYGAIADWFDADLIADLAERRPDWDFLLVGSTFTADLSRLGALLNVRLVEEQPYASLPQWIETMDVLCIPFKRVPLTEATNPVKAYEILAAGKPLVSVPLPEMATMAPHVRLASTAAEFEAEIGAALKEEGLTLAEERRAFARENTWERRFKSLAPQVRKVFPKVSIVIVTYNNLELNRLCLESLFARTEWPNFEVIAVDNGSTDGTAEYLAEAQQAFRSLHVVLNKRNTGFAAATNRGLLKSDGEFLVLLNNDTVVPRAWLSVLVTHLHVRPEIGLIGPVSNAIGNEAKVEVGYERIEDMPEWASRFVREHDGEIFPISMLAFFCVAMRREVFDRIGPLDERFGLGMFEDDDYNRRVRALGYEIACARDVFVHHWQKASFRLLGEHAYQELFEQNRGLFEEKWKEPWNAERNELDSQLHTSEFVRILNRIRDSKGAVVFLASVGWGIHLFQRPHHLARTFADLGYVVIFDCGGGHDAVEGFVEIEPNLFLFRGDQSILHRIPKPIVWSFPYNFHLSFEYPQGIVTVYDWIDDLEVFPHDREFLESNHQSGLKNATVVASVARKLDAEVRKVRTDALYLPNGVEYGRFANSEVPVPEDPKLACLLAAGRPIAGYYGALAEWFDYELLDEVACRRPDWSFLLIGPMYDSSLRGAPMLERPNVVWAGPRDYFTLNGYLRCFDVALIPFRINDITLATSPLKLYEYLAGGKPVITTAMPECQAFPDVRIVHDAEGLSRALDEALVQSRDERECEKLREIAREHSWQARIETVLARIQEVSQKALSPAALRLANRFRGFWKVAHRDYFNALCEHFAGLEDEPCLAMYFEYAVTTVERGRGVARLLAARTSLVGKSYLDIGCAYGGFLAAFAEQGARVTGIDLNEPLLRLARIHLEELKVPALLLQHDATKERPEFVRRFDVLTANDVIEHVCDLDGFLRNLAEWMRPEGVAYFEIPNGNCARAVVSDGHYQLFGITLLDFEPARAYHASKYPSHSYDTYNYLDLDEYGKRFAAAGLAMELLPETLHGLSMIQVEEDLQMLARVAPERLPAVPEELRTLVGDHLERYLAEAASIARTSAGEQERFLLRYGAGFWKVIARKVADPSHLI